MCWSIIVEHFCVLTKACREGRPLDDAWSDFAALSRASSEDPPMHLHRIIKLLTDMEVDWSRSEISILDHGTGTGVNLFYLAALGYTNIWGANTLPKAQASNRIFHEILEIGEDRIFVYDGKRLPLSDQSIQLVISQQVVEHVSDSVIEAYYADEGRVLSLGGYAVHHVPHRFMPYDSHTKTWLVHCLPKLLQTPIYQFLGHDTDYLSNFLFLRSPYFHMRCARLYIGDVSDVTSDRLHMKIDIDSYDGPRNLRNIVGGICSLPYAGSIPRKLCRPLMMLETVSRKSSN